MGGYMPRDDCLAELEAAFDQWSEPSNIKFV